MKFLEATEILTKNSPLGWVPWNPWWNFSFETASGDLLHLEPRVLWLLEPGGFEPGSEREKKKHMGKLALLKGDVCVLKRVVFSAHIFSPRGHVSWGAAGLGSPSEWPWHSNDAWLGTLLCSQFADFVAPLTADLREKMLARYYIQW